ncbi:MAG: PD40 domain-containing protein [Anaerolineae bacterium]|nr:PD40 domain-containing protein [Anaerolineae bacterium]
MLVRAFRVTDRLGNAFLRVAAWSVMALAEQIAGVEAQVFGLFTGIWRIVSGVISLIAGLVVGVTQVFTRLTTGTARQAAHGAREAYETTRTRHQEVMVQRSAEAELKPTIAEDPLRAQNRALSAFAVILLLTLLAVVVWQSREDNSGGSGSPVESGAIWPESRGTLTPTAIFPTSAPTPTPIPDPLRAGGSLVYAMRENGQQDLWAIGVGQTAPLRLTNHAEDDRDPAWSPDGNRIAFSSHRDGNWELYVLEINNGAITRLTYTPGFEGAPSWSPDGVFLVYEGYTADTEDLDIYIISADPNRAASEGALRVTYIPGPDIEPHWSPQGRQIAYVSWRTGNKDIYILDLDNPSEDAAINITNTPDINEDHPAWSPDGNTIAYTAMVNGVEGIYAKPAQQRDADPILVGRGKMPTWAPNGSSLVYAFDVGRQTQLLAGTIGNFGAATDAIALPMQATDPDWTGIPLPQAFIDSGGVPPNPVTAQPLYEENERQKADGLYGLALLNGVEAPLPRLSDRVNDSFEGLRIRVLEKTGYDFLGILEDAFWPQDRPPEPGEPTENWHYAGRAIALDRDLIYTGLPAPIQIVREDIEVNTYWRIFVRVADEAQNGQLGEPLRVLPWDFTARSGGDVDDYERGGKQYEQVPAGYYVDLTAIAADFGWTRVPAARTWQYNFGAIQFWEFHKTGGLSWNDAMLELYTPGELDAFLREPPQAPTIPALPPSLTPLPDVFRTPTPIPPDLLQ